jgi:DNA-binding transcriptional regulator YdaS (Cro superfamily)
MNQGQTARKHGISPSHFSQVLNGHKRFSWGRAKDLAAALRVSPQRLMDAGPDELREIFRVKNGGKAKKD